MGWETRARGGHYYTRSRRSGRRVVREYVGSGRVAELHAALDEQERSARLARKREERRERERYVTADNLLDEFVNLARLYCDAEFVIAGFHRHDRGEWRRVRG
jgi:hypothetical protein